MNKDVLDRAHALVAEADKIELKLIDVRREIEFIKTANKHQIIVEKRTMVPDPCPAEDTWGWSSPPMREHTESRIYSIDKDLLIGCLENKMANLNKELDAIESKMAEL